VTVAGGPADVNVEHALAVTVTAAVARGRGGKAEYSPAAGARLHIAPSGYRDRDGPCCSDREYPAAEGMDRICAVRAQMITMGSEWPVAGTQEFTTRPELAGTFGMVASTHWLASAAGMAVLEAGGNAFDAAVATGLVLQVVEPHLNGPGGEVPIIGYSVGAGGEFVIDGQGVAPAAATLEVFSELGIDLVPGNGLLPAMVPGAFGAWMLLLQRYGTLPLREVMKYAIGYAGDGYPILPGASAAIEAMTETFTLHWPTSA
jgi:Gamma-glutamyltranspeptidase